MSDISEEYVEVDEVESEEVQQAADQASEVSEGDEEIEEEIDEEGENEQPFDVASVSDYNREINIVPAEERITRSVLSVAEMTAITSIRAAQIQKYNNCLVDTTGLTDPRLMARRELMEGKCPLYVRRRVDFNEWEQYYEIWDPNTMTYATLYTDI